MSVPASASQKAKELAVIIVGYNSLPYLEECLGSLRASDYDSFQVIFVDNASSDGSAEYVRIHFPEVLLVPEKENRGFAGGNNLGMKLALEKGLSYVFLLNPDTVVAPNCLTALMAEARPGAVLQPLILLHRDGPTTQVNTAGNLLNYLGFSYCGSYKDEESLYARVAPIVLASGAAVFFPAAVLEKIGLFDEEFFMYHEDVDLSWRARLAGYDILLAPAAKLWHKYSFSRNPNKMYYSERNRLVFMAENYSGRLFLAILPFHIVNEILVCLYALASGWLPAKLRGYVGFWQLFPHIRVRRREVAAIRRRTDRELKELLSTQLSFSEVQIPLTRIYNLVAHGYWSVVKHLV